MAQPIAVQLYTLREAAQSDFEGVISQLAEIPGQITQRTGKCCHSRMRS